MRVVVDLTPISAGAQDGGLKQFVLSLLRDLTALASNIDFVLLTSSTTDAELASLDADNVRRLCVAHPSPASLTGTSTQKAGVSLRRRVRFGLNRMLPSRLMLWIERAYLAITGQRPKRSSLLSRLGAKLLFNPFGTPTFYEPGIPTVSLVSDVQFSLYPRFFHPDQRLTLRRELQQAVRLSDRIVCTADIVRRAVLEITEVSSARVVTIQPRTYCRLGRVAEEDVAQALERFGLSRDAFLLYPGSFRPHKNHGILLAAFGIYRARHPDSTLKLVFPGEKGGLFDELVYTTRTMGLHNHVLFPGFISDAELAALYQTCRAVLVPSLYEGLGVVLGEALAFRRRVFGACQTRLGEVAGDAAEYFDARLLTDVGRVIELAADDTALTLVGVRAPDDPRRTAEDYLRLFCEVAA